MILRIWIILIGLAQGSVPFPEGGVHVHIRPAATEVSDTAGEGPQLVNIDCTGWEVTIWVASKIMISAYVRTNIASQSMAPQ